MFHKQLCRLYENPIDDDHITTETSCTCSHRAATLTPCHHLLRKRKETELNLFDISLFASYYHDDFLKKGEVVEEGPLCESLEEFELEFNAFSFDTTQNTKQVKKRIFQNQQFLQMQTACHIVCETACAMPEERFQKYLAFVHQLADLMRTGGDVPTLTVAEHSPPPETTVTAEQEKPQQPTAGDTSPSSSADELTLLLASPPEYYLELDWFNVINLNEQLTDDIIDSSCAVLSLQFPQFKTQRVVMSQMSYNPVTYSPSSVYAQIHHLRGRSHYVLSVLKENCVIIYDSLPRDEICNDLKLQLEALYPNVNSFFVQPSPTQTGGVDCGLFCIANLFNVLSNCEVGSNLVYNQNEMRGHLTQCLSFEKFAFFPSEKKRGAPKKMVELKEMSQKVMQINGVAKLKFMESCSERGAPKKKKQRRFEPKFNKQ